MELDFLMSSKGEKSQTKESIINLQREYLSVEDSDNESR